MHPAHLHASRAAQDKEAHLGCEGHLFRVTPLVGQALCDDLWPGTQVWGRRGPHGCERRLRPAADTAAYMPRAGGEAGGHPPSCGSCSTRQTQTCARRQAPARPCLQGRRHRTNVAAWLDHQRAHTELGASARHSSLRAGVQTRWVPMPPGPPSPWMGLSDRPLASVKSMSSCFPKWGCLAGPFCACAWHSGSGSSLGEPQRQHNQQKCSGRSGWRRGCAQPQ